MHCPGRLIVGPVYLCFMSSMGAESLSARQAFSREELEDLGVPVVSPANRTRPGFSSFLCLRRLISGIVSGWPTIRSEPVKEVGRQLNWQERASAYS